MKLSLAKDIIARLLQKGYYKADNSVFFKLTASYANIRLNPKAQTQYISNPDIETVEVPVVLNDIKGIVNPYILIQGTGFSFEKDADIYLVYSDSNLNMYTDCLLVDATDGTKVLDALEKYIAKNKANEGIKEK